jgi:hypothetical protein
MACGAVKLAFPYSAGRGNCVACSAGRPDVPDGRAIVSRHERQADELSARWIERYRLESAES